MLTDNTRKNSVGWKGYMAKNNTCPCYRTVPDLGKCLRVPVKIKGNGLAAGCQLYYHKICGNFLQCGKLMINLVNWVVDVQLLILFHPIDNVPWTCIVSKSKELGPVV